MSIDFKMVSLNVFRMEQIVEKEVQKKKEEEETRKTLQERDEALRKQIAIEQEKLRDKELQMMVTWFYQLTFLQFGFSLKSALDGF